MSENWEHLRRAALVLVGAGAMKQRLIEAYRCHLLAVHVDELPSPLEAEFAELIATFNCAQAAGGLAVAEVAVRKMSEQDAARHAQNIVGMLMRLPAPESALAEPAAPPRLRVVGDDDEVPAFLSRA